MATRASVIFREFKAAGVLLEQAGKDVGVRAVSSTEECGPGNLVFVDEERQANAVAKRKPAVVVTRPELAGRFPQATVLTSRNVRVAQALIRQKFFDRDLRGTGWPRIHPSAVVHKTAKVAATAVVGPCAVIGRGARLGERCVIMANTVVEEEAVIGAGAVLHPSVVVGFGCEIGQDTILRSGTIIGSEGFGFAQDEKRKSHRIPHSGKVVVEDRVVIGSNCCIDRGTFGETRIGAGTIMDNLCHIAHNVQVGKDCILTAMLCVAGSTRIGSRVITSGQTGMIDHVEVCDDAVLVQRAGVANDIKEPGVYAGWPLMPLKEYTRNLAVAGNLVGLRAAVKHLERKVESLEAAGRRA